MPCLFFPLLIWLWTICYSTVFWSFFQLWKRWTNCLSTHLWNTLNMKKVDRLIVHITLSKYLDPSKWDDQIVHIKWIKQPDKKKEKWTWNKQSYGCNGDLWNRVARSQQGSTATLSKTMATLGPLTANIFSVTATFMASCLDTFLRPLLGLSQPLYSHKFWRPTRIWNGHFSG